MPRNLCGELVHTSHCLLGVLLAGAAAVTCVEPAWAQARQVTGVQLNPTESGLEIILETPRGLEEEQVFQTRYDNTVVIDIIDTQLRLPSGESFRQENPAPGIASIEVLQQYPNSIRAIAVGTEAPPELEITSSSEGIVLSVATPGATAETVPPAETEAETTQIEEEERIEVVVTAEPNEDDYEVDSATSATRTDTPILEIPRAVQVVPEQVLEDQQAIQLRDALRNVSGVSRDRTFGGGDDQFIIRGFRQDIFLRDGFRETQFGIRETANLERIEVLKGPASVLYGNLEPGGIVNLVTKQPLTDPLYEPDLAIGSFGYVRSQVDLSGPLDPDDDLLYRFNAAYETEDGNGFRDFDQDVERLFLAPVLDWNIGENTELIFEFEYLDDIRPFDRGIPAIGEEVADVPLDLILGHPDDFFENNQVRAGYRLEHRFNENWTVRNAFRYLSADTLNFFLDNWIIEDSGELDRRWRVNDDFLETTALQTNVAGEFNTGAIAHQLLFGVDLERTSSFGQQQRLPGDPSFFVNIFEPEATPLPERPDRDELTQITRDGGIRTDLLGIYLQDQISFTDELILVLGGRFDLVSQVSIFNDIETDLDEEAFSPSVGLVYQPLEFLSFYGNFSQSFQPNTDVGVDNELLDPERGTQFELGTKAELLDGRLLVTLAAFEITQSNVATTDPDNPDFAIAAGEVRSRGIELDVIGEILPGWNIIASYAHIDAEITEDNSIPEGNELVNVPRNSASLWTTYEIQTGDLQGLGFGAGVFFVGERQGDTFNTFELDSYARTDAAIFYRRNNWRVAVNIQNLFDIDYIEASGDFREYNTPGEPLTVIGSISVEF